MAQYWAERERATNKLVRAMASYVLRGGAPSPDQVYGLCKLTWITSNFEDNHNAYVHSTKIPALSLIFDREFSGLTLKQVATWVSGVLGSSEVATLINTDTGFTNFYKAYRNSARKWVADHFTKLLPLFVDAYSLSNDTGALAIIKRIRELPGVPKPNNPGQRMRPEYLLTPVVFSLDSRVRFPIINGNDGVAGLLSVLKASSAPLEEKYTSMIALYGRHTGIKDAADLDQVGHNLPEFLATHTEMPLKMLLEDKPVEGANLPLKDETDITALQAARTAVHKRLHNALTNSLSGLLKTRTLLEGRTQNAMFDVLVVNYDGTNDLLIEVKSSIEPPHIRMAIGQLFDYWFRLGATHRLHLAILLPEAPDPETQAMLSSADIGVLWLAGGKLVSGVDWLHPLLR